MFSLGDQGEPSSNKQTAVDANKASNVFFPTVKAVYDWAVGLFVTGAASSTDNAIARFDGVTGKLVQNSAVIITDAGYTGFGIASAGDIGERVTVNGNVQMGDIANPSSPVQLYLRSTTSATMKGADGSKLYFTSPSNGSLLTLDHATSMVGIRTTPTATLDINGTFRTRGNTTFNSQIIDNVGNSGTDGQVLKKVGGQVLWSNP